MASLFKGLLHMVHKVVQGDTGPVARCKSLRTSRQADAQEIFNAPLPVEVVLHIFSHLSARELCHVAAVSWSWNILSSHDSLCVQSSSSSNNESCS